MRKRIVWALVCMMLSMGLFACGDDSKKRDNHSVTLTSIAVTPANPSIAAGASQQFTATGTYSDNSTQDITASVTWTSSDTGKALVSSAGLATGVAAGTTTITATSGSISGTALLTVASAATTTTNIAPQSSLATSNPGYVDGDKTTFTDALSLAFRPALTLTWPSANSINSVKLYVGCNDDETMSGIISSGTSTLATFSAAGCGTLISFAPTISSSLTITMTGGGGSDNNISIEEIEVY